jgi:hypothetical protein
MTLKTFPKFLIFTLLLVGVLSFLILPHLAFGQDFLGELQNAGSNTGLVAGGSEDAGETQITNTIATGIEILLGFVGVIFLILMVYAGFMWMLARGNEQAIEKSKHLMESAIIGLVIVLAAYGITVFVMERLLGGGGGEVRCVAPQVSCDCPGGTFCMDPDAWSSCTDFCGE